MGNPDTGDLSSFFNSDEEALTKGYTSKFQIGELLLINGMFFQINNFVEDHNFMNLKAISKNKVIKILDKRYEQE